MAVAIWPNKKRQQNLIHCLNENTGIILVHLNIQNIIAEQKIRTQRIIGKLLKENKENGELDKGGGNVKNHQSSRLTSDKILIGRRYNREKNNHGGDRRSKKIKSELHNGTLKTGGKSANPAHSANTAQKLASENNISERTKFAV